MLWFVLVRLVCCFVVVCLLLLRFGVVIVCSGLSSVVMRGVALWCCGVCGVVVWFGLVCVVVVVCVCLLLSLCLVCVCLYCVSLLCFSC